MALESGNAAGVMAAAPWARLQAALAAMRAEMSKAYLRAGIVSAEILAAQVGKAFSFDDTVARVAAWLKGRSSGVAGAMVDTGQAGVSKTVADVLAGNWQGTLVQAAALIREQVGLSEPQALSLRLIADDVIATLSPSTPPHPLSARAALEGTSG